MRVGRGTRSAAVLMAGLVGAAVIAPGVALAQDIPPVAACAAGETRDAVSGSCEPVAGDDTAGSGTSSPSTTIVPPTTTTSPDVSDVVPDQESAASTPTTSDAPEAATPETVTPDEVTSTQAPADEAAADAPRISAITPQQVTSSLTNLTGADLVSGLPVLDALEELPTGNLDLGDVTIPEFPSSGSFSSPRDACLFLASKVSVDQEQAAAIGEQFASFCAALPGSFDPSTGYGSLPDLVIVLDRLCHGLKDTHHHEHHRHAWYGGRGDIDCGDVTADEAQAIYEADRSDPNNLDGDDDGRACEWNPDDSTASDYDGYPQGGVSTGAGPGTGTSGSASALGGLAVASLAGATRRRERDEERV